MRNPKIHIEASRELLAELQEAHGGRQRVQVLEAPPDASSAR